MPKRNDHYTVDSLPPQKTKQLCFYGIYQHSLCYWLVDGGHRPSETVFQLLQNALLLLLPHHRVAILREARFLTCIASRMTFCAFLPQMRQRMLCFHGGQEWVQPATELRPNNPKRVVRAYPRHVRG